MMLVYIADGKEKRKEMRFIKSLYRSLLWLSLILLIANPLITSFIGMIPMLPQIPVAQAPIINNWMWIEGGTGSQWWLFRNDVDESFTVEVWVDVTDLYAWEFKLGWNASLLNLTSVAEGDLLERGGTTSFYNATFEDEVGLDYVLLNCTLTDGTTVTDWGMIANATFLVEGTGGTLLDLYETWLWDSGGTPLMHDPEDGYFANMTLLYVSPGFPFKVEANPNTPMDEFVVNVWIDNITDLFSFGLKLGWFGPPPLLEATADPGKGPFWPGFFTGSSSLTYVTVGGTLTAPPGVDGTGMLAIVSLRVIDGGNSTLQLYETDLLNSAGGAIPHVTLDGLFSTTVPKAYFYVEPRVYAANQTITFNANSTYSFDPDGGSIASYNWTFQLGSDIEHHKIVTTPLYDYAFKQNATYVVTLNVTDDEGEWWTYWRQITTVYRDIAITDIYASHRVAKLGDSVSVYVTADNFGTDTEKFNVTAYYYNVTHTIAIDTIEDHLAPHPATWPPPPGYPPFNKTLEFVWNTAGVALGDYTVKAVIEDLPGENNVTNNEAIDGIVTISTTNVITYLVTVGGSTFKVVIASNSTVTDFEFDRTLKQISFNVTGSDGTFGISNVTVPKRLLSNQTGPWNVLWDGATFPHTIILDANATHTFFNLTYPHSSHKTQIIGTDVATVNASFTPSTTMALMGVPVTLDATASYDPYPDAYINTYKWTIGVVNIPTPIDTITQDKDHPILEYTFSTERIGANAYNVTLTVTSDSGVQNSTSQIIQAFEKYNIAITDITVSKSSVPVGDTVSVNVTVRNTQTKGGVLRVNVTVYYDDTLIDFKDAGPEISFGPSYCRNLTFIWDTTGLSLTNYTIKAIVTIIGYSTALEFPDESNLDDNIFISSEQVAITKWTSQVAISFSKDTLTYGASTTISGGITPIREGVLVVIYARQSGATEWTGENIVSKVITDSAGEYSYVWSPETAGTYEVKASWGGDDITESGESEVKTVVVDKIGSTLSLVLSADTLTLGSNVTISGQISPVREGVTVTILYRVAGGTWDTLAPVVTDSNGYYTYVWTPSTVEMYNVKATWPGDIYTLSDESDSLTVIVEEAPPPPPPPIPLDSLLYVAAGIGVIFALGLAVYFLKFRKPKTPA